MSAEEIYIELCLWVTLIMCAAGAAQFTIEAINDKRALDARWVRRDELPGQDEAADDEPAVPAGAPPPG